MNIRNLRRLGLGLLLLAFGVVGMTVTIAATYGHGAACQRMLFTLGLPGSLLLSSLSQCSLFFAGALLWSALKREASAP